MTEFVVLPRGSPLPQVVARHSSNAVLPRNHISGLNTLRHVRAVRCVVPYLTPRGGVAVPMTCRLVAGIDRSASAQTAERTLQSLRQSKAKLAALLAAMGEPRPCTATRSGSELCRECDSFETELDGSALSLNSTRSALADVARRLDLESASPSCKPSASVGQAGCAGILLLSPSPPRLAALSPPRHVHRLSGAHPAVYAPAGTWILC